MSHNVVNNFFLDAFEWRKRTNELVSHQAHFGRQEIPTHILIHGKTRTVEYVYSQRLEVSLLAEFIPVSSKDREAGLPKAYVGFY